MQKQLLAFLSISLFWLPTSHARNIEIDVYGMTCAFCVDSLERKFSKMQSVSKVEVSLKLKKIRLQTEEALPTLETIKQAVLDTGFTPVKITVVENQVKKNNE